MPCAACLVANISWHSAQSSPAYTLPTPLLSEHFHHRSPWALSVFRFTNVRKLLAFLFHLLCDYTCNILAPEHLTPQCHHILLWVGMGDGQSSTPFPRVATRVCGHLLPDGLSVFVSCDCCDKTRQNERLTTPKTFSLPAREARVWDQSVHRGLEPPKALREAPSCLFRLLGPQHSNLCLRLHVASSSVSLFSPVVCLISLLEGHLSLELGSTQVTRISSSTRNP